MTRLRKYLRYLGDVEAIQPLKYCLYARKSSEQDERQAMSIDSQLKEMLALAERDGLEIVETKQESHSAKQSGYRSKITNRCLA